MRGKAKEELRKIERTRRDKEGFRRLKDLSEMTPFCPVGGWDGFCLSHVNV